MMARRMTRNSHVRCRTGEKVEECRAKTLPIVMSETFPNEKFGAW